MELSSQVKRCEERASGLWGEWGMREGKQKICPWLILTSRNPRNFRKKMRFCVCVWILVVLSLAVTIMEKQSWDNVIAQSLSVLLFLSFSPAFFHPSGQWVTPCCPSAGRRTHYLQLWLMTCRLHNTYDLSKLAPHTSSLPPNESLCLCSQDLWQQLLNFNQKMTTRQNPEKGIGKQLLKHIFLQLRIECLDRQRTWLPISLKDVQ